MEEKRSVLIVLAVVVCGVMSACVKAEQCGTQAGGATCGDNNCCSKYGWCGSSDQYCGDGCQSGPCSISIQGSGDDKNEQCGTQAGGATCGDNNCCSKYGWCGSSDQYCGDGCQSGPCSMNNGTSGDAIGRGNNGDDVVGNIISDFAFDQFLPRRTSSSCPANGFYTRRAFLLAASAFQGFGTTGDDTMKKRELAAFFANIAHKSGSGCYKEKIAKGLYCDRNLALCAPGQQYYGRGPLQMTWNNNYWIAGNALGFDGINNPNIVSSDPVISFKTAVWYWMTQHSPTCHGAIVNGQGFGATMNTINGAIEGDTGSNQAQQKAQTYLYKFFCSVLNVDPGNNLKMVI